MFYSVYSSAENKEASLPASTILLAYVRRNSVPKWSVRWVGGWVSVCRMISVVQVINNQAHSTCAPEGATD